MDQLFGDYHLDKSVVSVCGLADDLADRMYWHAQSPDARMRALEFMRRVMYGDAAAARLQRVLAVAQREPSQFGGSQSQ